MTLKNDIKKKKAMRNAVFFGRGTVEFLNQGKNHLWQILQKMLKNKQYRERYIFIGLILI